MSQWLNAPGRTRTFNFWLRRPALSPVELPGLKLGIIADARVGRVGTRVGTSLSQRSPLLASPVRAENRSIAGKAHSIGRARLDLRKTSKQRVAGSNPAGGIALVGLYGGRTAGRKACTRTCCAARS